MNKIIKDVAQDDGSVIRTVTITQTFTADQYATLTANTAAKIAAEQDQVAQMQTIALQSQKNMTSIKPSPVQLDNNIV